MLHQVILLHCRHPGLMIVFIVNSPRTKCSPILQPKRHVGSRRAGRPVLLVALVKYQDDLIGIQVSLELDTSAIVLATCFATRARFNSRILWTCL
jgi:hypothetical protein